MTTTECTCSRVQEMYDDGSWSRSFRIDLDEHCPVHSLSVTPREVEQLSTMLAQDEIHVAPNLHRRNGERP